MVQPAQEWLPSDTKRKDMVQPAKPLNKLYHSFGTFYPRTITYGRIKQAVNLSCADAEAPLPFDQI